MTPFARESQDTRQEMQVVSLKDAARALGIGESAVRKRLSKGQLTGEKDAKGQWLGVMLPAGVKVPPPEDTVPAEHGDDREVDLLHEMIDLYKQEIAARERENEFLRQRVSNMEVLLGQALQNARALLPPEHAAPTPETPEPAAVDAETPAPAAEPPRVVEEPPPVPTPTPAPAPRARVAPDAYAEYEEEEAPTPPPRPRRPRPRPEPEPPPKRSWWQTLFGG